jgi:hypothetical protein
MAITLNGTTGITTPGDTVSGNLSVTGNITSKTTTTDNSTYPIYMKNSTDSTVGFFRSDGNLNTGTLSNSPYNNTTTAPPNMYVSSSGDILRSTSTAGQIYTGSDANLTDYPIGTVISVNYGYSTGRQSNRNQTQTIYLASADASYFTVSGTMTAGAALSGTWRARGQCSDFDNGFQLFQRTA